MISIDRVPEFGTIQLTDEGLVVGAGVTVAELNNSLLEIIDFVAGTYIFSWLLINVLDASHFQNPRAECLIVLATCLALSVHHK